MKCSSCGEAVPPEAAFCTACGLKVLSHVGQEGGDGPSIPSYRLLRSLTSTEFGQAWLVRHEQVPQDRFLQIVSAFQGAGQERVSRFRRAVAKLTRLNHPNLASHHDLGQLSSGELYYVREYVPGRPLSEWLDATPLALSEAMEILRQVAAAMQLLLDAGLGMETPGAEGIIASRLPTGWTVKLVALDLVSLSADDAASPGADQGEAREAVKGLARLARQLFAGATVSPPARVVDYLAVALGEARRGQGDDRVLSDVQGGPTRFCRGLRTAAQGAGQGGRQAVRPGWVRWWPVALLVVAGLSWLFVASDQHAPSPGRGEAGHLRRARELIAKGEFLNVVQQLAPSEALPTNRAEQRLLGQALSGLARSGDARFMARAITLQELLLARDPLDARALRSLGELHAMQGDMASATASFDAALLAPRAAELLGPESWASLMNDAAVAHAGVGHLDRAEVLLSRLLTSRPAHAEALTNRGVLHLQRGRVEAAEQDLRTALAQEPELLAAQVGLAQVLRRRGKLEEARERALGVLEESPDESAALNLLGMLAEDVGEAGTAREYYQRASAASPGRAEPIESLARLARESSPPQD